MGQHVITIVVSADDPDFSTVVDDAVNALAADGHTPTEVRVQSDAGEQVIPVEVTEPPANGGATQAEPTADDDDDEEQL